MEIVDACPSPSPSPSLGCSTIGIQASFASRLHGVAGG